MSEPAAPVAPQPGTPAAWGPAPVREPILSPGARQAATEARDAKKEAKKAEPKEVKGDIPDKKVSPLAVEAPKEAQATEPKKELLSPQLAKLAHREKVLLEREKAAKEGSAKAEAAAKGALEAARAEILATAKSKGLAFLTEDAGVPADDIVKAYLGLPPPKSEIEKRVEANESKVDAALKAYEQEKREAQQAQFKTIQDTIKRDIKTAVPAESYPLVTQELADYKGTKNKGSEGVVGYIYDIMVDAWETKQQVLTSKEVADGLERFYKIREQFLAKEEPSEEPSKVEKEEEVPKQPRRPLSASRAVAVTSPAPSGPLTKDQRYERAMAVLRAGRSKQ